MYIFQKPTSITGDVNVIVRMAVAVKRKIQLYYWKVNEFKPFSKEIIVNDIPKSMVWCKESICVGFRNEYTLFDVNQYVNQAIHL